MSRLKLASVTIKQAGLCLKFIHAHKLFAFFETQFSENTTDGHL